MKCSKIWSDTQLLTAIIQDAKNMAINGNEKDLNKNIQTQIQIAIDNFENLDDRLYEKNRNYFMTRIQKIN